MNQLSRVQIRLVSESYKTNNIELNHKRIFRFESRQKWDPTSADLFIDFCTFLVSQERFNLLFEKAIAALDRFDDGRRHRS